METDTLAPPAVRPAATPLTAAEADLINAYWRAANYLSVGQIYLYDNPLLKEPLRLAHVKPLVVGHYPRPELHLRSPQPGCQKV